MSPGGHGGDKGRQTGFFTPLDGDPDKGEPRDDYTFPQKVHYKSHWKRNQDAVYWSHAIIVHSLVQLQSYLSKRRSNIVRKTLESTICAKSHTQKQFAAPAAVNSRGRDLHKETCAAQDGLKMLSYKIKPRLNEINEKLEKLKVGSCTKSFRNDLSKGTMIIGGESRCAIYEMGNMELIDLTQTSATIQCLASTQSKYIGPNQRSICSVKDSLLTVPEMSFQEE